MRALQVFGVACSAFATLSKPVCAATIVEHASAKVSGDFTIDKYGLFGPAGANLAQEPMKIKVSYDSSQYGPAVPCGTDSESYATVSNPTRRAATIEVTIGDVTVVYKSTVSGQVQFYNDPPGLHSFAIAANGDFTLMSGTGAGILMWFRRPTKFAYRLVGKDLYTDNPQDYFIAFAAKNGKSEEISFYVP